MEFDIEERFKEIGTVEILRPRMYAIDPMARGASLATEALVSPGTYPVISDGYTRMWLMQGYLNGNSMRRGDGTFIIDIIDRPLNIEVTFPSAIFGPDEWAEMLSHETAREGHPEQRLRFNIKENK